MEKQKQMKKRTLTAGTILYAYLQSLSGKIL